MTMHPRPMPRPLAALVLAVLVLLLAPGTAASADDTTVAWSVSPAGADGGVDGRTRLSMQLDPGATATDRVLVANASSTDQTFTVYGADAFNTSEGGYDLLTADKSSTDAGSWVSVDHPQITVPASSSAVVTVTVAVPAGATPGDHAAGVVVSRAVPQADQQGVILDTRVAVRLSVRVAGALAPALSVRDVHVAYAPSWVPFGPSDADVTYTVRNDGNVTVLGEPRVRITGPFGTTLAVKEPGATREVLPGQSFEVRTSLGAVEPALVDTAVVDVSMAAAPGPDTQVPLVSSTARSTFAAVPWSGLGLVVVLVGAVWWWLRARRARRAEAEAMWAELAEQAKAGQLPVEVAGGRDDAGGVRVGLLLSVLVAGAGAALALGSAAPAGAADDLPSGAATVTLAVPAPPPGGGRAAVSSTQQSTTSSGATRRTTTTVAADASQPQSQVLADEGAQPASAPVHATRVLAADTLWRNASGFTPAQWGLVAVSGALLLGGVVMGVRALVLARAARP